jgi:hypothetical protein
MKVESIGAGYRTAIKIRCPATNKKGNSLDLACSPQSMMLPLKLQHQGV